MDFKDIRSINHSLSKLNPNKTEHTNLPRTESQQTSKDIKNAPSNPDYWQNTAGIIKNNISFKANNQQANNEYIEECLSEIHSHFYWQKKEELNTEHHRNILTSLIPYGKQAMDNYKNLIINSSGIWNDDIRENYNALAGEFIFLMPDFASEDFYIAANLLQITAYHKDKLTETKDFISQILAKKAPEKTNTLLWLNSTIHEYVYHQKDNKDFLNQAAAKYDPFMEFISNFSDYNNQDKNTIISFNFTKDELENCNRLMKDGIIKPYNIYQLLKQVSGYTNNSEENAHSVLEDISKDNKKADIFSILTDKTALRRNISIEGLKKIFETDINFLKTLISKLQEKNSGNNYIFHSETEIFELIKSINPANLDDFLTATKGLNSEDSLYKANHYINPKTGLFDKRIITKQHELEEMGIDEYYSAGIAKSCIDLTTGDFSPEADEVLEMIYRPEKKFRLLSFAKDHSSKYKKLLRLKNEIEIYGLSDFMDSLKDKKGSFNKKNLKCLKKLLVLKSYDYGYSAIPEIVNLLKDKDGVVDRNKYECALNILKNTKSYSSTKDIIKELSEFSAKSESNMKLSKILSKYITNQEGLNCLNNLYNKHKQPDGSLPDYIRDKIIIFAKARGSLYSLEETYNACLKNDTGNFKDDFDFETFNKVIDLMEYEYKLYRKANNFSYNSTCSITGPQYIDILNQNLKLDGLPFKNKVEIINILTAIRNYTSQHNISGYEFIDNTISDIDTNLSMDNISLPITPEVKSDFIKNVLNSNNSNELTNFEKIIKSSVPFLESLENGLPITYPREKFLRDLSDICQTDEDIKLLQEKTGILPITQTKDNRTIITGYNDLIKLDGLDKSNPLEKRIYDCMYKFMYENTVNTGKKELDEQLNYIIKACPEFINTIGKKQHNNHKYTLDIHSLLVMAYSISNEDYLTKLNESDRTMIKLAGIFHDIIKKENEPDKGHQNQSSLYARSIVKKFFNNPEHKDRLCEIVQNHHWLEELMTSDDKETKSKELAFKFRRPNDFEIAKIMAKSDLKAVSPAFYEGNKESLNPDNFKAIENNLKLLYSTGNAIFTDYFRFPEKLTEHTETKDGIEYKVVNFHKIKADDDLSEYGFLNGLKKEDVRFLVHMVDSNNIYHDLKTVQLLTSPLNGGVLSESLISPLYKKTYGDRQFGVILSQINTNIVNENNTNQGSGYQKDFYKLLNLIFDKSYKDTRQNFRNCLLENLNINPKNITDEEYEHFYRNVLANKTSLLQINQEKEYNIGSYNFKGSELIDAIKKYQDNLIDKEEKEHNELVGFTPKIQAVIAKTDCLNNVPADLLKFAKENNYPVVLI